MGCTDLQGRVVPDSTIFRKADSIAAFYHGHSLKNLKLLSDKLTATLSTEKEKFRVIYKWVCDNIDNDYALNVKNQQKRAQLKDETSLIAWNRKANEQAFRNLIEQKKTVCTGYAYLVRELALQAGLTCKIVDGYGRTVQANIGGKGMANHSWNAVRLDGQWYLCDATWSSGACDARSGVFIRNFNEAYFLADPAMFVRNHYPLDSVWMLLRDKPALETFLKGPLVYVSAFNYGMEPLLPATFEVAVAKGEDVSFQFIKRGGRTTGKVTFRVDGVRTSDVPDRRLSRDGMTQYTIKHRFTRRGTFAVHIIPDDALGDGVGNPAFTYRVTVR
jgi:hypothetical protein